VTGYTVGLILGAVAGASVALPAGFFIGRRFGLAYRENNHWLGEDLMARKIADWVKDHRDESGEHPIPFYDFDDESSIPRGAA
jgi:hypothetical protein